MLIAGHRVAGVGLGTAQFAFRDGTPEDAVAIVRAALDAGVRLIDTARPCDLCCVHEALSRCSCVHEALSRCAIAAPPLALPRQAAFGRGCPDQRGPRAI
jgi:hypothetical protein